MPNLKKMSEKRYERVNLSVTPSYMEKLRRLSISCSIPHTTLANELLEIVLDSSAVIKHIQEKYNRYPEFWILPIKENGKVSYAQNPN